MKYNKTNTLILVFTLIYTIFFGIYFFNIGNFEFVWYVGILFTLTLIMFYLHKKFKFSSLILAGSSLWGFLHMLGGGLIINGEGLYAFILINIYNGKIPGMQILKYDQFMHFYTYIIITLILFHILNPYLRKEYSNKVDWLIISVILIFASVGVGAGNEIIEFVPVVAFGNTGVGGYHNTLLDLVFNTLGAIVGVLLLTFKKPS